jgi:pyruvate dehydrogenase E1 component alpha subunit
VAPTYLFVCENNGYAMGTALAISESEQHIFRKAQSYGLAAHAVDGMNVVEVESAASQYCNSIRNGDGPCLLECKTYRFRGHSMFDTQLYRKADEVEEWKSKGPIKKLKRWLEANNKLNADELIQIEDEVAAEINQAIVFAEKSPLEDISDLYLGVYAEGQS